MAKQKKNLTPGGNATEMTPLELLQKTCARMSKLWEEEAKVKNGIANCKAIIEDLLDNHRDEILGNEQKIVCENVTVGIKYTTKEKIDAEKFNPLVIQSTYPECCEVKVKIAQVKAYFKNPQMKQTFEALGYSIEEVEGYDISKSKVINIPKS
mgnify:CR=1 FL=1